jgi:hypothetical protein
VRHGFHNLKLTGEAAGADDVAENFPAKFLSVIQENGYLPQQVFNLDETGLFWKRTRFVPKVSVLIFLCTTWECSTSLMYTIPAVLLLIYDPILIMILGYSFLLLMTKV